MSTTRGQQPFLNEAIREHHALQRLVDEMQARVEERLEDTATDFDVLAATGLLENLRYELEAHFAREEMGGYLEEAIAQMPAIADQAAVLHRQHGELLKYARDAEIDVKAANTPREAWQRLQRITTVFVTRFMAHEAAENKLLARAYNEDLSALQ